MIHKTTVADLHIHSTASDGTMTPAEIIDELITKGIGLCSLTDHNSIDNQNEFISHASENGIICIPGVELNASIGNQDYHVLAYGFDPSDIHVEEYAAYILSKMKEYNRKLISLMSDDFDNINLSEYDKYSYDRKKGGWETIQFLYEKGMSDSLLGAMQWYRRYAASLPDIDYPHPSEVCREIHSWKAMAVLAHPNYYFKEEPDVIELNRKLDEFREYGIDGVECHYPSHSLSTTETSLLWCRNNNMLITAGCDCHGGFVPGREIGKIRVTLEQLNLGQLI